MEATGLDGPSGVVHAIELPDDIRRATALSRLDYSDAFLVDGFGVDERVSPEAWLREMLEHAPTRMRRELTIGWRLLGLRLTRPGSNGTILGWRIRDNRPDLVVVSARSWTGLPAELVVARHGHQVVFATLETHRNPAVGLVWRAIEDTHRRIVQQLLEAAAGRLAAA